MALSPPDDDFVTQIRDAVVEAGVLVDQIVVLDPNTVTETDDYDPVTGMGGTSTPMIVLSPRAATITALGAMTSDVAGVTQERATYSVQFIPQTGDAPISKGMVVRVLAGGRNPLLPPRVLQVTGELSGSLVALVKLECVSTGAQAPIFEVS